MIIGICNNCLSIFTFSIDSTTLLLQEVLQRMPGREKWLSYRDEVTLCNESTHYNLKAS